METKANYAIVGFFTVMVIFAAFGVGFIIVGELEKKEFSAGGLAKFAQLPVLLQKGDVTIYGWSPSRS